MPVPAGPVPEPEADRPSTGTVTRPSTGTAARPSSGTVPRPVGAAGDQDLPGNVQ